MEYIWSKVMQYLARDTFHVFGSEDILKNWEWRGNRLDDETIAKLKEEAAVFQNSLLWKILKSEVQWRALKDLLEKGEGKRDLGFTRQVGYVIRVLDEKLDHLMK